MTERSDPPLITLLTDFGYTEPFVGVMKGVMLRRLPSARLVDLTHGIAPQSVAAASFWLARAFSYFPEGTIHLVVVDPGVGGERRVLVAEACGHWFVLPDNGLLTDVARCGEVRAYTMRVPKRASATFQGRDVFAPLAAKLAAGELSKTTLGTRCDDWVRLDAPGPFQRGLELHGRVVVCDHFGNLISNLEVPEGRQAHRCLVGDAGRAVPIVANYAAGAVGAPVALENSWNLIEIAANQGNASEVLGVGVGASVVVELRGG